MKRITLVLWILLLTTTNAFAYFHYQCSSADGKAKLDFEDVSHLFGNLSPIFAYEDDQGINFNLVGSGFRVRDDGITLQITGRVPNHPDMGGFSASLPVLYHENSEVAATMTLTRKNGSIARLVHLTCTFHP